MQIAMIENLPSYIPYIFTATTALTVYLTYWIINQSDNPVIKSKSIKIILILGAWLLLQAFVSLNSIYIKNINALPPKIFIWGILPNILAIIWIFTSKAGKRFMDSLSSKRLSYLHLVRIPVEFVLYWLFLSETIPKILTFEGWNFDIIMGLTAPLIIYFGFVKRQIGRNAILIWNIIGIVLLSFVFVLAILTAPFPLQQLGFDQPNIALLYFPFSWLPTFIVPIVILGHLITIRQLAQLRKKE